MGQKLKYKPDNYAILKPYEPQENTVNSKNHQPETSNGLGFRA